MAEPSEYKQSAINSFRLAVELFNRPHEEGRVEAVLIHLNHAFEMLLKGALLQNGVSIRDDDGDGNTIPFEKSVNYCRHGIHDGPNLHIISETEGALLLAINQQRDFAEHEIVQINEQQLFLQSRQSIDIFAKVLNEQFGDSLADYIPERVLPLATMMPVDIVNVIETEVDEIRSLIEAGEDSAARQKLRAIESIERGIQDEGETPTKDELDGLLGELDVGESMDEVFPGTFSAITGDVDLGGGRRLQLGDEGIPATYIPQEDIDDDTDVYFFTEKNLHDTYSLNPLQLRDEILEKLDSDITWPRMKAVMKEMGILDDRDYYRPDLSLGAGTNSRQGYKPVVAHRVAEAIDSGAIDPDEAWEKHKEEFLP